MPSRHREKHRMTGKIVKGIAGFYYVDVVGSGIYECKAKGIFRKEGVKPLVGDLAEIEVLDPEKRTGNLVDLLPRKNELIRPAVANVDQALIVFALKDPEPNHLLLDRFLVMLEQKGIPAVICFNKKDLADEADLAAWQEIYRNTGYRLLFLSAREEKDLQKVRTLLKDKVSVVAGPSGVGKSTLINQLQENVRMETGEISRKLQRGKHTTRHAQLITIAENTYIFDTPGFTSLYTDGMEKEDLKQYFPEFETVTEPCRFLGCVHRNEPDCAVKTAVKEGRISRERYRNYKYLFDELNEKEKRRY